MNPVAWLVEYAPELRMATFATVVKAQAERIKAERKGDVTVTPLYPLPIPPEVQ